MSISTRPRQHTPEWERDFTRLPALGYEAPEEAGWIRCLAHGYPTPLARWHYHEECELHIITATSGKAFVGDWIGQFQPGHVVLVGPRLPHNWISTNAPESGVAQRDLVIQFLSDPLQQAASHIAELKAALPLLERAKYGIEFFGITESAIQQWHIVKNQQGISRLAAFCALLGKLATCSDYRLLSSRQLRSNQGEATLNQVELVVNNIMQRIAEPISADEMARATNMSKSQFSRFFHKNTGNTFTDFVNRLRINRACQLLMESDQLITDICYEVGFNNIANFNRRFLHVKGLTPSAFRKQSMERFQH